MLYRSIRLRWTSWADVPQSGLRQVLADWLGYNCHQCDQPYRQGGAKQVFPGSYKVGQIKDCLDLLRCVRVFRLERVRMDNSHTVHHMRVGEHSDAAPIRCEQHKKQYGNSCRMFGYVFNKFHSFCKDMPKKVGDKL